MRSLFALTLLFATPVLADGAAQFAAQCASCHQPDGSGVEGMFPPLAKRLAPWLALPAGREYVAQVMMNGRFGKLMIDGKSYDGFMPTFAHFDDQTLVELINHLATGLNQTPGYQPVTVAEVQGWRAAPKRDAALDALRASLPQ